MNIRTIRGDLQQTRARLQAKRDAIKAEMDSVRNYKLDKANLDEKEKLNIKELLKSIEISKISDLAKSEDSRRLDTLRQKIQAVMNEAGERRRIASDAQQMMLMKAMAKLDDVSPGKAAILGMLHRFETPELLTMATRQQADPVFIMAAQAVLNERNAGYMVKYLVHGFIDRDALADAADTESEAIHAWLESDDNMPPTDKMDYGRRINDLAALKGSDPDTAIRITERLDTWKTEATEPEPPAETGPA